MGPKGDRGMRGVSVHAVLLMVAAVAAFLTWTREAPTAEQLERPLVWERDTTELVGVSYRSESHQLDIERRDDDGDAFLWGTEVRPSLTPDADRVDTLVFPVGQPGGAVMNGFAEFRVLRELGALTPDRMAEFGLDEPDGRVTVRFGDESRIIDVGDAVHGGTDRYGRDPETEGVFVLPADLIGPLRTGSGAVRERRVHYFPDADVARVHVEALGRERVLDRRIRDPRAPAVWTSVDEPDEADQTFANFMERVGQLAIQGFDAQPDPESLERLVRIEYSGEDGEALGFLELFRGSLPGVYYLSSERTRVPAGAIALLAQRVEQDLSTIF
jgi:hypothetical protein